MSTEGPSPLHRTPSVVPHERSSPPPTASPIKDSLSSLDPALNESLEIFNPELRLLRQKVTDTFLTLLVEVFTAKETLQDDAATSRLIGQNPVAPKEEIELKLQSLLKDLNHLEQWTKATRKQVQKALEEGKISENKFDSLLSKFRKMLQ